MPKSRIRRLIGKDKRRHGSLPKLEVPVEACNIFKGSICAEKASTSGQTKPCASVELLPCKWVCKSWVTSKFL